MAQFKVIINTNNYRPCNDITTNLIMYAMNGWTITEHSYNEVLWRLRSFIGYGLFEDEYEKQGDKYYKWLNKKNNRIVVNKDFWYRVELPVIAMGYIDCNELIKQLKKDGNITLDFSLCFDTRQNRAKNFKGCYMTIFRY